MPALQPTSRIPWAWVPSLYIAEGIPYVMVMTVSVILYKRLGVSNTDIALYTGWLYLPWVIKPFWSPFVDLFKTKRHWILQMQIAVGIFLACIAVSLPAGHFFRTSLAFFWFAAFSSATHDIAADGFYMLALPERLQSAFIGVRSTFYRIATIGTQGLLVIFAGSLEVRGYAVSSAWSIAFLAPASVMLVLFLYHLFLLPRPSSDRPARRRASAPIAGEFLLSFILYFKKKEILSTLAFFLFYRLAETQLIKIIPLFLLDPRSKGGLGLTTSDVGMIYGTVGVIALMLGGLVGGYVVYRKGLRFWIWVMAFAMHLPDMIFVYLSGALPENVYLINLCIGVEQFGYGFGLTAYTLYMIMICEGEYKTVHYAISTGIMALGMMVPAMTSGWLQERLGYPNFFLWVMIATIPGFLVTGWVRIGSRLREKRE